MADGRRERRHAHAHEITNVTYGRFGAPTYQEALGVWHFQRDVDSNNAASDGDSDPTSSVPLRLLQYQTNADATISNARPDLDERAGYYTPKRLLKYFPELTAAAATIIDFENEDGSNLSSHTTSLVSDRIIFARAPYANIRNYHTDASEVPFVASVSAENRASLILSVLQLQPASISRESGIEAQEELPLLSEGIYWAAPLNEPILQLCYAPDAAMIAYRQSSASTLCLPFTDDRLPESNSPQRIILKPVLTVPADRTGGYPHADIVINSGTGLQLGVIDTHGNWSVWEVAGKRSLSSRLLHRAMLRATGKLFSWTNEQRPSKGTNAYFDGWHKICFIQKEDRARVILVANRRTAILYDNEGAELQSVDMRLQSASDWILDIWIGNAEAPVCVVLTSSRIVLMHTIDDGEWGTLLDLVCSTSHFLGGGSILKMSVLEIPNGMFAKDSEVHMLSLAVVHLFLYSKNNPNVTLFIFSYSDESSLWSTRDPLPFQLFSDVGLSSQATTEILVAPIRGPPRPLADIESGLLIKILLKTRLGGIVEGLYRYLGQIGKSQDGRKPILIPWPDFQKKHVLSSYIVDEEEEDDLDDFIERNGVVCSTSPANYQSRTRQVDEAATRIISRDWTWVLENTRDSSTIGNTSADLREAEARLFDRQNSWPGMVVLQEIVNHTRVNDIEEADDEFSEWMEKILATSDGRLTLGRVGKAASSGLLDIYAEITDEFVTGLSQDVADRLRVNTERLSRQVAMDLALSSVTIQRYDEPKSRHSDTPPAAPEETGASSTLLDAVVSRLGRYTSLTEQPLSDSVRGEVPDLLAHLPDNAQDDPDQYSYADIELSLAHARHKLQTEKLEPAAKRRAERIEAARRKRAEKAAAAAPSIPTIGQELPVAVLSSSQGGDPRGMTQPERGDFGKRPLRPLKWKKPKIAGFG